MIVLSFFTSVLSWLLVGGLILAVTFCSILLIAKAYLKVKKQGQRTETGHRLTVGFFHPYCNAGGGGERVLWCAIRALQLKHPDVKCVVYTGDYDVSPEEILNHAKEKFNIHLQDKVDFIFLKKREWVEAKNYPYFTLLGQSFGSVVLAFEAINLHVPDVFIDSMGYAFSYFVFKTIANCKVGCYVHYPTISKDMLSIVTDRTGSFNNRSMIANSRILTNLKLLYYHLFAWCYGSAGSRADVVMVNSSWTQGHVRTLWGERQGRPVWKIFPPCDIKSFLNIPVERPFGDIKTILSISQFRPEKNHKLQIISFAKFLSGVLHDKRHSYRLILAGGCRNQGDQERVDELKALADQLCISDLVQIEVNIPFPKLQELLATSFIGLHTMKNEHFGIGVVEFQAAGVIALAHNSGGPKMDIVIGNDKARSGFLAETAEEYAASMDEIFSLSQSERNEIASAARLTCKRFSGSKFEEDFLSAVGELLQ